MHYFMNSFFSNGYYQNSSWMAPLGGLLEHVILGGIILGLIIAWSLAWKAIALWKAARKGESIWFVVLMLVNTLGVLEILYLYVFSKKIKPVDKE